MFRKILEFGYRNSALTGIVAGAITFGAASVAPDIEVYLMTGKVPAHGNYLLQMEMGAAYGVLAAYFAKARAEQCEKEEKGKQSGGD